MKKLFFNVKMTFLHSSSLCRTSVILSHQHDSSPPTRSFPPNMILPHQHNPVLPSSNKNCYGVLILCPSTVVISRGGSRSLFLIGFCEFLLFFIWKLGLKLIILMLFWPISAHFDHQKWIRSAVFIHFDPGHIKNHQFWAHFGAR